MFRKKRSSSQPPTQPPPAAPSTPSATSAAALAFLNKRASEVNLSSAAAAAALRSHQATPEPVGSIQTKRMIRRGSTSSIGSGSGSIRQPFSSGLQRTGSTASLSNRTFRSPSPGGRNVPSTATLASDVPPIPSKSHRRNPSAESSQRVASPRLSSPVPHQISTATNGIPPATTVKYDPNTRTLIRVPVQPSSQQPGPPGSPRSINFSRPMSPPVTNNARLREPTKARPASAQGFLASETLRAAPRSSANPAVRQNPGDEVVPALVAASAAARTSPASPAPPVTKTGVSASKPTSAGLTASGATPPQRSLSTSEALSSNRPKPNASAIQMKPAVQPAPIPAPSQEQIKAFQTRAASMLARPRSDAAAATTTTTVATASTTTTVAAATTTTTISAAAAAQDKTPSEERIPSPSNQQQAPLPSNISSEQRSMPPSVPHLTTTVVEAAKSSHSPTRSAHFSESPLLDNIKHQPPPRALSPAKSALKAPSPRPSSPAGSTGGKAMSDTSETRSEDGVVSTQKKKKVVRVSFDEQPELVGEAATPQTPINTLASPQYRKGSADSWTSTDDHEYTPRPTLPSFGSIRGRKSPSTPEREQSPQTPTREPQPSTVGIASPATSEPSAESNRGTGVEQPVLAEPSPASSKEHDESIPSETVPAISILPATPRPDQETREFISNMDAATPTVAGTDTTEQGGPSKSSPGTLPLTESLENRREQVDTESDENAEIFADAAEDHSDMDANEATNAHFMESSTTELAPQTILEDPDEGSTVDSKDGENVSETAATNVPIATTQTNGSVEDGEDWERIRRYWNSLSEERRQELEREATATNANELPAENKSEELSSIKQAPLPPWPDREYQKSSAAKPTSFPQSLRAGPERTAPDTTHLKTTLRDNARPVSAHVESQSTPLSTQRPKSAVITSTAAASANAAGVLSHTAISKKEPIKPSLERKLSNDSSASESSFRRRRRGSVASSEGGGFSLRRTMRAPKEPEPTSPPPTRTSLRTKGDVSGQGMRTRSLRTNEQPSTNRTSIFGMGKSSKPAGGFGKSGRGGFKSRFDDSSDEETEGQGRPHFLSRFDDSDESEDETSYKKAALASPSSPRTRKSKRQASVDSSDMSTGGNETKSPRDTTKKMSVLKGRSERPSTPPNPNGAVLGTALHAGTLRTSNEGTSAASSPATKGTSKRGFFGLGKKQTHTTTKTYVEQPSVAKETSASPKVTKEPETPSKTASNTRPKSGFFRRLSTSAAGSTGRLPTKEDFPYPPPPIPASIEQSSGAARPNTSDGISNAAVTTPTRPPLGSKRDSSMTAPIEPVSPIVSVRTGKKKKFQGLRRLLRVQD